MPPELSVDQGKFCPSSNCLIDCTAGERNTATLRLVWRVDWLLSDIAFSQG
jgi:hypothetical protein